MNGKTGGHIFLSHGSENRDEANAITRYLEERGLKVWIAPRDVRPGVDYSEALQEAIEACAAFVVLVTDQASKSPYVRVETEMAFSLHKPIFPVRTTDVKPGPGLALFLKIRHWTDAYGPQSEESMERLARELCAVTGVSDRAPPAEAAPAAADLAPEAAQAPAPGPAAFSRWTAAAAASGAPPTPTPTPTPPQTPGEEPRSSSAAATGTAADDDELLRAYVGPNADHYLARWRTGTGGWSWTAFLFTAFWAAYRKMWPFAAALAAAFLVLNAVGTLGPIGNALSAAGILAIAIWFGLNGNRLYRRQAQSALAPLQGEDRMAALGRARAAGGTSVGAMAGLIAVFLAVSAGMFFLLRPVPVAPVLPAQQPGAQGVGEQPAQPQPGAEPELQPDPQPRPAAPTQREPRSQPQSQPQPQARQQPRPRPLPQSQPADEYYTPPPEDPPTEGFYDPPQ